MNTGEAVCASMRFCEAYFSCTMLLKLTVQTRNQSLDEFINEFKAARKTYHKRNIWAERWSRGEVAWRDD